MTTETVFYEDPEVKVTSARLIVGAQTFAMRGITSVKGVEISPRYTRPITCCVIGVVLIAAGLGNSRPSPALIGLGFLAVGFLLLAQLHPTFAVVLRTADGDVSAYENRDKGRVAMIIHSLNESMIAAGS